MEYDEERPTHHVTIQHWKAKCAASKWLANDPVYFTLQVILA